VLGLIAVVFRERLVSGYLAWQFRDLGLLVLEDFEPEQEGDGPGTDRLQAFSRIGELKWFQDGLGQPSDVFVGGLAIDRERSRIYVATSQVKGMDVTAFGPRGQALFSLGAGAVAAITVDEGTGSIWCLGHRLWGEERTLVHDVHGQPVASHPWWGKDIAYNRFDESLWIAGGGALKIDRQGQVLGRGPGAGTGQSQVEPDHRDGSVWILGWEWDKSGTPSARVLRLDASATLVHRVEYPGELLFPSACDPRTGVLWVAHESRESGSVARISPLGEPLPALQLAARGLAFSERTGLLWVATKERILALDHLGTTLHDRSRDPRGKVFQLAAP
jgi:hypothetical protein